MSEARTCAHCGEALVRFRNKVRGRWIVEGPKAFARRRFCNLACEKKAAGAYWSEAAVRELLRLKDAGLTHAAAAEAMSHTFGLGEVTRNMVTHRLRHPYPTVVRQGVEEEPEKPDEAESGPVPIPEPRMDKPAGQCRYGDCRNPRQPGRDGCAEHHRLFVAAPPKGMAA